MSADLSSARAALGVPALARLAPRLGAFLFDLLLAVALLQLIAPPAYMASGGRVQLLNAPYGAWRCEALSPSGSEMARAVGPKACQRSLFGHVFASATTAGAAGGPDRRWEGPVDAAGRPIAPLDLGWLLAPLFAAVRLWFEAFGMRSPGRALFRQRLIAQAGRGPSAEALLRRYGALIGPFLLIAWGAAAAIRFAPGLAGGATGAAALALLAIYGAAALAVLRRRRPFHDRAAATAVVEAGAG